MQSYPAGDPHNKDWTVLGPSQIMIDIPISRKKQFSFREGALVVVMHPPLHEEIRFSLFKMLNCLKITQHILIFWIVSWSWLDESRWHLPWNNNTYRPFYITNTMPADTLATLGGRASAGMVLSPKAGILHLQQELITVHQNSVVRLRCLTGIHIFKLTKEICHIVLSQSLVWL